MGGLNTNDRVDPDSDDDNDAQTVQPASSLAERRRVQDAIFDDWLNSDDFKATVTKSKEIKSDLADEEQSIHALMKEQYTETIKHPRDYQLELFERAKQENTIAVLDTGSGKTLISVLLLRWIIDQELENRASGQAPKISFFLTAAVTLAHQQFSVLENNLDHKVTRICGADNADIWGRNRWQRVFAENKIIVCTADILLLCLAKSFITMKQVNLLIFDEAHHAKKNHAYARILKDYYHSEDTDARPRIFGMTASPVDAKADVALAVSALEAILDSKIATTTDMSLQEAVKKPWEGVISYPALTTPVPSEIFQLANKHLGPMQIFQPILDKWPILARELGTVCADQCLLNKLSDKKLSRYEIAIEQKFHRRSSGNPVQELDNEIAKLRSAVQTIRDASAKFLKSGISAAGVTDKVLKLRAQLADHFERPTSQRCIVFVDRRDTARLLDMLFKKIGTKHMRSTYLVGGNSQIDEDSFSFREQVMALLKFRKGEFNCLFATSVAEEGLDIPDCNLVIRFNVAQTMIQYVQSRGRARQRNSKFIHMMETGNSVELELLNKVRTTELEMRNLCQLLPKDRELIGNQDCLELLMSKEKEFRVYTEPETGAKLTYGNSMVCLAMFVSSLPCETDEPQHPFYDIAAQGSKFTCEVLLPGSGIVPLRSATGLPYTQKKIAKRSAAFEACRILRDRNYLDQRLLPIFHKKLPVMRNALLAVNSKKTNQYLIRDKPNIWKQSEGTVQRQFWLTVIDFPQGLERQHQPLALITRTSLPDFPQFPVFLNDSRESVVASRRFQQSLTLSDGDITKLSAFTFRIFRDIFSKTYEEELDKLSYWLAPASVAAFESAGDEAKDAIDWKTVEEVFLHQEHCWVPEDSEDFLLDRFLVDRWDGSRKFFSVAIDPNLRPLDPVPEDAAKHKYMENIMGYSVSLWKKSREQAVWNPNQPVIVAEKILTRRNLLATPTEKEMSVKTRAYLCPEPLKISAIPPSVAASCVIWPAIIHRFESYMIAQEACNLVGIQCDPALALAAVTKDSDNTGEHDNAERINFRHGMGENYERLEFIGDTFLKTATTISTFIQNPNDNEFDFHVKRMRLLCNKNLFQVAVDLKLYEYIRSKSFTRRVWYPEGLKLLEGKGAGKLDDNAPSTHGLADKTIADVSEALIGAAFVSHDRPGEKWRECYWEDAVRAVTKLTTLLNGADSKMPTHEMTKWNDYRLAYEKPEYQTGEVTASQRDLAEKIMSEHPYRFNYPRLLRAAFIHPSQPFMHEKLPNYQRLEFLGDALLDTAFVTHLFYRYPDKDPQWLTEHKMAMVSNKFLGAVCVTVGFHKHLRHCHPALEHQITQYVMELSEAGSTAGDRRDYWTTVADPPKCLPDIVESFVGAMFIDADFDYNVVQDFFNQHMKWYFEDMSIYDTFANNHPCTRLQNLLQTTFGCQDHRRMTKPIPSVDSLEVERKDLVSIVMVHDQIIAHSKGKSSRYSEVRAAKNAIDVLEGLAPFEFRSKFGCNCHPIDDAECALLI